MPIIKQLSVTAANRPGQLARICESLAQNRVNITGLDASGPNRQIRLLVNHPNRAQKVLQKAGWTTRVEEAVVVNAADRPGQLARIARKLAQRGVNINYAYATVGRGSSRAAIVLGVSNARKAAQVVK
jgi:hypothetical protein